MRPEAGPRGKSAECSDHGQSGEWTGVVIARTLLAGCRAEFRTAYHDLLLRVRGLIAEGLAAAIYTQTTDVEAEINGFLTYDRAVLKLDPEETAAWHRELYEPAAAAKP